jgi:hypothetical protein
VSRSIYIYCDGGFGNRLNTLISGLAIAHVFQIPAKVYWPRNNWCQASFAQIFTNALDVSDTSLSDLAGTLAQSMVLLHDTLGADTLKVPFQSAYTYQSLEDFQAQVVATGKDIFYYPALIPPWLPMNHVVSALRGCSFQPHIRDTVSQFVGQTIGLPFHGLHLRRTDLNVGYSDEEVQTIVRQHPQQHFFVCSDDPIAEALAAVHPHVHRRDKSAYVGKRNVQGDWMALTADDDGRMYHSNIDRNADSVVDAVTDMLILAHSSIVGYSGSTFQNMARLFGQHAPMVAIAKPAQAIEFLALSSAVRMIQAGSLALSACVGQGIELFNQGHRSSAIALEKAAIEHAEARALRDVNLFLLHYNVAAHLLSDGHPYEASLYAEKALALMPASNEAVTLLNMTRSARGPTALHQ